MKHRCGRRPRRTWTTETLENLSQKKRKKHAQKSVKFTGGGAAGRVMSSLEGAASSEVSSLPLPSFFFFPTSSAHVFRDEISEGNFNNFCHFRCSVRGLYVTRTRGQKLSRHIGKISFDKQVMYKVVSWICDDDMKRDQCRRSRTKEARNCSLFREAAISMLARWGSRPELMNFVRGGAILRTIPRCLRSPHAHVSDRLM